MYSGCELNTLQLKKTSANRQNTGKLRKRVRQIDNCKHSQHNQMEEHNAHTDDTNNWEMLQVAQMTMDVDASKEH